jgi:hypothetical protein
MNTIRKFAYATVLTLSALNFSPSLASAQEAGGTFKLSHDVHWQNIVVPAGEYRFFIESNGPASRLTLRKLSGSGSGFVMLVSDTEESKPADTSRLVMVSRPGGSFVKQMQLPEFGVTLHFVVPEEAREVALATATTAASAAR